MEDEDGHTCDGIVMSQEDMEALDEGQLVDIGEERLSEIECEADKVVEVGEERQSETECEADEVVEIGEERQSETECEADEVVEIGEERQSEIECEADEVWDEDDGLENADILDEIVRDVAGGQTGVEIEPTLSDISETKLAEEFVAKGCGCTFLKGEQCCQIMANSNSSSSVVLDHGVSNKERQRSHCRYSHGGQPICRCMFQFFHIVGKTRLNNLILSFKEHGLTSRIHGNKKRLPHNALSLSLFC